MRASRVISLRYWKIVSWWHNCQSLMCETASWILALFTPDLNGSDLTVVLDRDVLMLFRFSIRSRLDLFRWNEWLIASPILVKVRSFPELKQDCPVSSGWFPPNRNFCSVNDNKIATSQTRLFHCRKIILKTTKKVLLYFLEITFESL